jgi:apolipoprotein N-acyltransferase
MIAGLEPTDGGRVLLDGEDITGLDRQDIVRRGIGRAFQVANLFPSFTVAESLPAAILTHERRPGVTGMSFPPRDVAALAAAAWPPPGGRFVWRLLAAAALLVLLPWPFETLDFTRSTGTLEVALVQTNVPQDQKFAAEHVPEVLEAVARDLLASRATLTVAPETAVPLLPSQLEELAPGYWAMLAAAFDSERAALVGVPLGDFEHGYTNSVVALGGGSAGYRYDKWHLVPFGEFIPMDRWFPILQQLSPIGYSCTAGTNSVLMRVPMRGGAAGRRAGGSVGTLPRRGWSTSCSGMWATTTYT